MVKDNKNCADLFAKTFREKVDKLIKQVGNKDAMTEEINEKFPHNLHNRSPQFETSDIIKVIGVECINNHEYG
jgi:hypothetical protein